MEKFDVIGILDVLNKNPGLIRGEYLKYINAKLDGLEHIVQSCIDWVNEPILNIEVSRIIHNFGPNNPNEKDENELVGLYNKAIKIKEDMFLYRKTFIESYNSHKYERAKKSYELLILIVSELVYNYQSIKRQYETKFNQEPYKTGHYITDIPQRREIKDKIDTLKKQLTLY